MEFACFVAGIEDFKIIKIVGLILEVVTISIDSLRLELKVIE